jgi:hypothetical protein
MSAFEVNEGQLTKVNFGNTSESPSFKSEKEAKAYIMEFHKAVLTSPDYFEDLVSPFGSKSQYELS